MDVNVVKFTEKANELFPNQNLDIDMIKKVALEAGTPYPLWLVKPQNRVARGQYMVPSLDASETVTECALDVLDNNVLDDEEFSTTSLENPVNVFKKMQHITDSDAYIPVKFPGYVPFGFFKKMEQIIKSNRFFPVFISGDSGNGKTLMVEQVCAKLHRELVYVSVSIETDQTDLLGGPTLVNGNVVDREGPVINAMRRGAILLLDEVDRGSNKLLCLQGIADGKPYYNKHTGEVVYAKEGFNIVATANTKGRGSDNGKYLSQILDDAFLERFPITVEQEYPSEKIEAKIVKNALNRFGVSDDDFAEKLVMWAKNIRKTRDDGSFDEIISTRRLDHIAEAYAIFGDRMEAIEYCVARFDSHIQKPFIDLYKMVDETVNKKKESVTTPTSDVSTILDGDVDGSPF